MKMRNEDLKKITEIKQYLLDPPVSFKLNDYALQYLNDVTNILKNYTGTKDIVDYTRSLTLQLESKSITPEKLRKALKDAGIKLSKLTSR